MENRRRFIITLIRGGIFASLAIVSGSLFQRRNLQPGCREKFACDRCNLTSHCRLPEADDYRLEKARSNQTSNNNGKPRE